MQYVQHVVHTVCSTQKAVLKTAIVWVTGNRRWVDVSHWQTVSVCILLLFCYLRVTVFKVPVNTRNNTTTTSSEQTITVHAKNGKFDRDVSCTIRQGYMGFSVDSCKEIQRICCLQGHSCMSAHWLRKKFHVSSKAYPLLWTNKGEKRHTVQKCICFGRILFNCDNGEWKQCSQWQ